MVSDQEIAHGVENLLRHSDPNTFTSLNGVVQHLEAKLGLDLSHKAGFIRDQIELLLRPPPPQPPHPQPQPPSQKDHFALQHHPQFQNNHHAQISHHFAIQQQQQQQHHHHQQQQQQQHHHQQQQQQQRHHEELNFQLPHHPQHPNLHPHQHLNHLPAQVQQQSRSHPQAQKNAAPDTPKESAPAKRKGGAGGLNKVCGVSPELQAIVGEPKMPRTEIVKQLWAYIRKNNLQDPSNKRKIICNDELRLVFETDCTDMFKMNKLLSKHITRLEPPNESASNKKRAKVEEEAVKVEEEAVKVEEEAVKVEEEASESTEAGSSLVIISDPLAKFFGSGGREMVYSEALKRVSEYIEVNQLKDPMNPMVILCDEKLQELFGCESISALGVAEMVGNHLFKQS